MRTIGCVAYYRILMLRKKANKLLKRALKLRKASEECNKKANELESDELLLAAADLEARAERRAIWEEGD